MIGQRCPNPSKFAVFAILGALAVSMNGPVHADQHKPAPIKYLGQGSGYAAPSIGSSRQIHAANTRPETANLRTKRIEFRYPDQPNIVHGSDGTKRRGQGNPIKFSTQKSAAALHSAKQVAAISQPTPTLQKTVKAPILSQPRYNRPIIEETVMDDIALKPAPPAVQSALLEPVAKPRFDATGLASWYGEAYHGQPTANGEIFNMNALSAAHPTLPLPSLVQVTNLNNGKEIVVRVNDRGPFVADRMIDMSKRAAEELGFVNENEAKVRVRYLGPAPVVNKLAGQGALPTESAVTNHQSAPIPAPEPFPQVKMDPIPNPGGPTFFIQAGSFSEMSNAQKLSRELGGSLPVDVALANVKGADFFRVLIGPYSSRTEAAVMRDQLDFKGIVNGILVSQGN